MGTAKKKKENLSSKLFPQYAILSRILQRSKKRLWNLRNIGSNKKIGSKTNDNSIPLLP